MIVTLTFDLVGLHPSGIVFYQDYSTLVILNSNNFTYLKSNQSNLDLDIYPCQHKTDVSQQYQSSCNI